MKIKTMCETIHGLVFGTDTMGKKSVRLIQDFKASDEQELINNVQSAYDHKVLETDLSMKEYICAIYEYQIKSTVVIDGKEFVNIEKKKIGIGNTESIKSLTTGELDSMVQHRFRYNKLGQ